MPILQSSAHSTCVCSCSHGTRSTSYNTGQWNEWVHKWAIAPPPFPGLLPGLLSLVGGLGRSPASPGSQLVISCFWKTSPAPPNLPNRPGQPALATRACGKAVLSIGVKERQEAPGLHIGEILTHLLSGMRKSRASCSARLLWPPRIRVVTVSCRDRSRNLPPSSSSRRRCSRRSLI